MFLNKTENLLLGKKVFGPRAWFKTPESLLTTTISLVIQSGQSLDA